MTVDAPVTPGGDVAALTIAITVRVATTGIRPCCQPGWRWPRTATRE